MKRLSTIIPLVGISLILLMYASSAIFGFLDSAQVGFSIGILAGISVGAMGFVLTIATGTMSMNFLVIGFVWGTAGLIMPRLFSSFARDPALSGISWLPALICILLVIAAAFSLFMSGRTARRMFEIIERNQAAKGG